MPQLGGIGITAGVAVVTLGRIIEQPGGPLALAAYAMAPVWAVALIDDLIGMRPLYRATAQLVAAVILVGAGMVLTEIPLPGGVWSLTPFWAAAITILFTVWMVNLYNFMDGIDGLAAGMAVIGFAFLAVIGSSAGATGFAAAAFGVVVSAAGFLVWNFPPARTFMGDVGSTFLGFLAAYFTVWGSHQGLYTIWTPVIVFAPFIIDATVTLLGRLAKGERVWVAHRSHLYQRLVLMGYSHRQVAVGAYLVMVLCGLSATSTWGRSATLQAGVVLFWLLLYAFGRVWASNKI